MPEMIVIANRTAVRLNSKTYAPGDTIPQSVCEAVGEKEMDRLLAMKSIAVVEGDPDTGEPAKKLHQPGKWNVNPDSLAGKTLEQLNAMLIEKGGDSAPSVIKAIEKLSSEFSPLLDPPTSLSMGDDDTPGSDDA